MGIREKYLRTWLEVKGYIRAGNEVHLNLGVVTLPPKAPQEQWGDTPMEQEDGTRI